jgi:hypothetical protein
VLVLSFFVFFSCVALADLFDSHSPLFLSLLVFLSGEVWARQVNFPADEGGFLGYGFSYLYRRSLWESVNGFPDKDLGEDIDFIKAIQAQGRAKLDYFSDERGIAVKFFHSKCSSGIVSQYVLPHFVAKSLFGEEILSYIQSAPA